MEKIKINLRLVTKIFPVFISIIILASLLLTFLFLYKNFYQTIIQAQKIKLLKGEVSIIKIDMDLYKEVIVNLEKKREIGLEMPAVLKDPFQSME